MKFLLYYCDNGSCPYLGERKWQTCLFSSANLDSRIYADLLNQGWRRSGTEFYFNTCPGCNLCIPIRINTSDFRPSKSQRRAVSKNSDITIRESSLDWDEETYDLYVRYSRDRHRKEQIPSPEEYMQFLCSSPVDSQILKYYLGDTLVAAGWIDLLPDGFSSVYFAFDPELKKRSLGIFSVVKEIEIAKTMGKSWYYLGFYVPGSKAMEYKNQFQPTQYLWNQKWETSLPDKNQDNDLLSPKEQVEQQPQVIRQSISGSDFKT